MFLNPRGFKGSNPNGLALSPDERTLYVTEGGTNAVADGQTGRRYGASGRPPSHRVVSEFCKREQRRDAALYREWQRARRTESDGCGYTPSPAACHANNSFIFQRNRAGFLRCRCHRSKELGALTEQVAENDHFRAVGAKDQAMVQFLRGKIHHVVYIIKENRSYDQVLGDLENAATEILP